SRGFRGARGDRAIQGLHYRESAPTDLWPGNSTPDSCTNDTQHERRGRDAQVDGAAEAKAAAHFGRRQARISHQHSAAGARKSKAKITARESRVEATLLRSAPEG